jgi:hypothetical protein
LASIVARVATALDHFADQQVHREAAVAAAVGAATAVGQQEVVHAADALFTVPQAGGDARTQRGHDQQVFVVHEELARQHLDRLVAEVGVVEEERGLARFARCGLEPFQA